MAKTGSSNAYLHSKRNGLLNEALELMVGAPGALAGRGRGWSVPGALDWEVERLGGGGLRGAPGWEVEMGDGGDGRFGGWGGRPRLEDGGEGGLVFSGKGHQHSPPKPQCEL